MLWFLLKHAVTQNNFTAVTNSVSGFLKRITIQNDSAQKLMNEIFIHDTQYIKSRPIKLESISISLKVLYVVFFCAKSGPLPEWNLIRPMYLSLNVKKISCQSLKKLIILLLGTSFY